MSGIFVEDPWTRIIGGKRKKKDDGPPPDIPPDAELCGFYELHNGIVTFTDATGAVHSFDRQQAYDWALSIYETNDPPGYPHDAAHHTGGWFTLGPFGITFNLPHQQPNAFNVPMAGAIRFLIQYNVDVSNVFDAPPPGSFGNYLTWTNFFDVSTWVWHPNTWTPMYTFNPNTLGMGYANMAYATGPYHIPPQPTVPLRVLGDSTLEETHYLLNYIYDVEGTGILSGDPWDPSQGGTAMFTQMPLTNNPLVNDLREDVPPEDLPLGVIYVNNQPNRNVASEIFLRITGYCRH